jgi:hypothetical protein
MEYRLFSCFRRLLSRSTSLTAEALFHGFHHMPRMGFNVVLNTGAGSELSAAGAASDELFSCVGSCHRVSRMSFDMLLDSSLGRELGAAGSTSDGHSTAVGFDGHMFRIGLVMVHQAGLGSEFNTAGGTFYQRLRGSGIRGSGLGGCISEQGESRTKGNKSK